MFTYALPYYTTDCNAIEDWLRDNECHDWGAIRVSRYVQAIPIPDGPLPYLIYGFRDELIALHFKLAFDAVNFTLTDDSMNRLLARMNTIDLFK